MKEFFEKVDFEKVNADNGKGIKNYPACKEFIFHTGWEFHVLGNDEVKETGLFS